MTTPNTPEPAGETPQQRFERLYITSSEICRDMHVTRPSLQQARRKGYLPDAIPINDGSIYVWERAVLRPYLDAWRTILTARRQASATA